jgi:KDO2-lipid IV(A) lauroyltransferase
MAKLSHEIEYLSTRLGISIARSLPASWADRFGARLGAIAYHLMASRRKVARENLQHAFADELSAEKCEHLVKEVFRNIGRSAAEMARRAKIHRESPEKLFVSDGLEKLKEIHALGKGGIILGAHFGSFELFGLWIALTGFPANFLVATQSNPKVNKLIDQDRLDLGVGTIPTAGSARGVLRALRRNEFVGILSDQHAPSGMALDFFGRPAAVARGPAVFSLRAGAPILPVLMRRERYDRHVLIAGEIIHPNPKEDSEVEIRRITVQWMKFLEDTIRRYPDQWLWTHRRWKL